MAHISVICPRCGSRYQVDPNLRGKNMRCPNAVCRAVFEVREEVAPAAPVDVAPKVEAPAAPRTSQASGAVGEIVPILQAEAVTEAPVEAPPSEPTPASVEAAPPLPVTDAPPDGSEWERQAPPVRARG